MPSANWLSAASQGYIIYIKLGFLIISNTVISNNGLHEINFWAV